MSLQKKISSAVTAVYPLVAALLIIFIFSGIPVLTEAGACALSILLFVSSMAGKRETFFIGIILSYPILLSSQLNLASAIFLLPLAVLSTVIYAARFLSDKAFRTEFFKKGLLFYGITFFALATVLGGILYSSSIGGMLLAAIPAIAFVFLYHTCMALGDHTVYIQKAMVAFGAASTYIATTTQYTEFFVFTVLALLSSIYLAIKTKSIERILSIIISFLFALYFVLNCFSGKIELSLQDYFQAQISTAGLVWEEWIFGLGANFEGSHAAPFFTVIATLGAFGLLALLTHLKHVLELFIRHISAEKSLLLLIPITVLLLPMENRALLFSAALIYIIFVSAAEHSLEKSRRAQIDNVRPLESGRKPRVLFPFIEAGKGHITPTTAVCDIFKAKYGDKVEVIESHFYSETGSEDLVRTERLFASAVRTQNKNHTLSLLCRLGNFLAGDTFAQYVLMAMTRSGRRSIKLAKAHLAELNADLIFTAHWSIPFYVSKDKKPHPYTIMFCPDVLSNGMFNVDCNHFLMPMRSGHDEIKKVRMYAGGVSSTVAFPIRSAAYEYLGRKDELREKNGIEQDAFVVTLCDGGYGMANLEKTLACLMKSKAKMTLIALCGTNTELYERLSGMEAPENITLLPQPFTQRVLEFLAMSDLFVGKSGANSMAEPAFFGVPIIVTKCITYIERHIKYHYVHDLGGALFIPNPKRAAKKIIDFAEHPERLEPYKAALESFKDNCGAEEMADLVYDSLKYIGYAPKSEESANELTATVK